MDIICVHSDERVRKIIKNELNELGFNFGCFAKMEEAGDVKAHVILIELKKDNIDLIDSYPFVIPLIRTTDGDLSYELGKKGIEYITVDSLQNFKQKFMKILLKSIGKIEELSKKDSFQKNTIYAYGFEWGRMYIVSVDESSKIHSFIRNIPDSISVFIATRERPIIFEGRKNMRAIWITDILGKDRIRPHNLTVLTDIITKFIEKEEKRVVVMDCIEYLLLYNDLINVLRNLELINSYIMEYKSLLILIIDEDSYSKREISLLRRYAVRWNGGA